jgi:hypothetical protein
MNRLRAVSGTRWAHDLDAGIVQEGLAAIARKQLNLPPAKNDLEDISQYSPAAQVAMYDLDRFLALVSI